MLRPILRSPLTSLFVLLAACSDDGTASTGTETSETGDTSTSTGTMTTSGTPTTGTPTTSTTATGTDSDSTTTTTSTTDDTTTTTTGSTTATTDDTTTTTTGSTSDTDTSSGTTDANLCGNGAIDDGEMCDGADLAGQDCIMQGFDAGDLACAADCTFDTAACVMFTCGNGVIEGNEVCDGVELNGQDCVMQGFEAGTLTCLDNCSGFELQGCSTCGDGNISGAEVCDGVELNGLDCVSEGFVGGTLACAADCGALDTSACTNCGDGVATDAEACDGNDLKGETCQTQGGDFGTLGCAADCTLDLSECIIAVDETEPNDDGMVATGTNDFSAANANGPYSSDTLIAAAISPAGDDDVFAVTNPTNGYVLMTLETFGPGGPGTCAAPVDTQIDIRTAGNVLLVTDDEGGINSCSLISNYPLAPGETLYVRVFDWQDNDAIASYYLDIKFVPVVCGDGAAGPGEQCDDNNVDNGDGCSDACKLEAATQEIEPNNTSPEADANGIVSTGNSLYGGAILPGNDVDRWRLDLAAPQFLRMETFSKLNDCTGITTTLRLYDNANTQIINDTTTGIGSCSALVFPVPAGTFYMQVEETGTNAAIPTYLLEARTLADLGTETEPNDVEGQANTNIQAGSDVFVYGDHSLNAETDFYVINVPVAGSSLRLEIIEGDRAVETCESLGIDSRLTLFNGAMTQLADDNIGNGRGYCSLLDGTGTTPLTAGAHNLAAGTYYVRVRASTFADEPADGQPGQFVYRLVATVRTP